MKAIGDTGPDRAKHPGSPCSRDTVITGPEATHEAGVTEERSWRRTDGVREPPRYTAAREPGVRGVPSWFRREQPDDDPTGQISAQLIKEIDTADVHARMERALADRQALIKLCLYAIDRARSGGVVERLEQGLAGVGVTAVRPAGQRFDPALHEAGGAVLTDDPALEGMVAETEVAGYTDRDTLLRAPIVTVYRKR